MARKRKEEAHHGGAWKVAYADFVTAMMAFFMVLWILGLNVPVKQAISAYFNDPMVFLKTKQVRGSEAIKIDQPFKAPDPKAPKPTLGISKKKGDGVDENKLMKKLKEEVEQLFLNEPALQEFRKNIHLELTREGLRIELFEQKDGAFFSPGSGNLTPLLQRIIRNVSGCLKHTINPIIVEGHTDAKPTSYARMSNWELSTERANAARRILEEQGLGDQVEQVRGFAAQRPFVADPMHPSNRRISLLTVFTGMSTSLATPAKGLYAPDMQMDTVKRTSLGGPGDDMGPSTGLNEGLSLEPEFGPPAMQFSTPTYGLPSDGRPRESKDGKPAVPDKQEDKPAGKKPDKAGDKPNEKAGSKTGDKAGAGKAGGKKNPNR